MNIFLIGKAGSGKSTIAQRFIKEFGYTYTRFAEPMYDIAYRYFNMDKNIKDRKLLQIMGTEAGRQNVRDNVWVDRVIENVKIINKTCELMGYEQKKFILDDCRFYNEFGALIENGWTGFYIDVDEKERIKRLELRDGVARIDCFNHASETEMDSFKMLPYQIDGNGSEENTFNQILEILNEIRN